MYLMMLFFQLKMHRQYMKYNDYKQQKIDSYILKKLKLPNKKSVIKPWTSFTNKIKNVTKN